MSRTFPSDALETWIVTLNIANLPRTLIFNLQDTALEMPTGSGKGEGQKADGHPDVNQACERYKGSGQTYTVSIPPFPQRLAYSRSQGSTMSMVKDCPKNADF